MDYINTILEKFGASPVDFLLVGAFVLGGIIVWRLIKWDRDRLVALQNEWEMTFADMQVKMEKVFKDFKEQNETALAAVKAQNEEHLKALQLVVEELKQHKTWAGECGLLHKAIDAKFETLDKRLDKMDAQITELQKQPRGRIR
jgi:hypothetical protein